MYGRTVLAHAPRMTYLAATGLIGFALFFLAIYLRAGR